MFEYRISSKLYIYRTYNQLGISNLCGLFLVFNFSENTQQAMFVVWLFSMIFMLMSGIFTPIASMPHWAEIITYANPIRYFADAMRSIFLKGAGLRDN